MSKFEQTFTRTSTDIMWHGDGLDSAVSDEFSYYVNENYVANGKLLSKVMTLSNDDLVLTITRIFNTEQDRADYLSDATRASYITLRDSYNATNNIVHTMIEPMGATG